MARFDPTLTFSQTDFAANTAVLAKTVGYQPEDTPLIGAILRREGESDFLLKAKQGSFISAMLIDWLSDETRHCLVGGDKFVKMMEFCQPILNEPGHPMVNFMKGGAFSVEILVMEEDVPAIGQQFANLDEVLEQGPGGPKTGAGRILHALDYGLVRAAEHTNGSWTANPWVKHALAVSLRENPKVPVGGLPGQGTWFDNMPLKSEGWGVRDWDAAGFQAASGCIVQHSAHVAPGAILMPNCFVAAGAWIGPDAVIGANAVIGAGAQIGADCVVEPGAVIGSWLDSEAKRPAILEDGCRINANAVIGAGVIVGACSIVSSGVHLEHTTTMWGSMPQSQQFVGKVPSGARVIMGVRELGARGQVFVPVLSS